MPGGRTAVPELPPLAGPLALLPEQGRAALVAAGTWEDHRVGAVILEQGSPADDVHLVAAGRVRIVLRQRDDHDVLLGVRGPGASLGDLSVFNDSRRSAAVLAIDEVRTLRIDGNAFVALLQDHPPVMFAMLQALAMRLREAERRLVDLGNHTVKTRVARRLLEHAVGELVIDDDGVHVEVPVTVDELAAWAEAAVPEVEQALTELRRTRLIDSWGTGLAITDLDGLRVAALM